MTLKSIFPAVLIAAMPMAAQAGQASTLTLQLNEPLSNSSSFQGTATNVPPLSAAIEREGSSAAMAKARAHLEARYHRVTDIELTGDPLKPAREATT